MKSATTALWSKLFFTLSSVMASTTKLTGFTSNGVPRLRRRHDGVDTFRHRINTVHQTIRHKLSVTSKKSDMAILSITPSFVMASTIKLTGFIETWKSSVRTVLMLPSGISRIFSLWKLSLRNSTLPCN